MVPHHTLNCMCVHVRVCVPPVRAYAACCEQVTPVDAPVVLFTGLYNATQLAERGLDDGVGCVRVFTSTGAVQATASPASVRRAHTTSRDHALVALLYSADEPDGFAVVVTADWNRCSPDNMLKAPARAVRVARRGVSPEVRDFGHVTGAFLLVSSGHRCAAVAVLPPVLSNHTCPAPRLCFASVLSAQFPRSGNGAAVRRSTLVSLHVLMCRHTLAAADPGSCGACVVAVSADTTRCRSHAFSTSCRLTCRMGLWCAYHIPCPRCGRVTRSHQCRVAATLCHSYLYRQREYKDLGWVLQRSEPNLDLLRMARRVKSVAVVPQGE